MGGKFAEGHLCVSVNPIDTESEETQRPWEPGAQQSVI